MSNLSEPAELVEYPDLMADIKSCLEDAYPEEGCGLVVENPNGDIYVDCCQNLADKYHEADPHNFPRTAETFYVIDPKRFLEADKNGEHIHLIFHSHVDRGDYFSTRDRQAALIEGQPGDEEAAPAHPESNFLVVSVKDGTAREGSIFVFNPDARDYRRATRLDLESGEQIDW